MVKVSSVYLVREEGTIAECNEGGKFFPSFADANRALARMAHTAPAKGGYDKVTFVVTYEDGEEYEGRFDLKRDHEFGASIASQMVRYLSFYAGACCPSNSTKDSYERFILARGDKREACVKFLATYELFAQ